MRIDVRGAIVPNDEKWVYEWLDMEATCPKDVHSVLEQANGEKVDVYINSGGGDVWTGVEIFESIRAYSGGAKIHVVWAASAASVIACAAESEISPAGMVMLHNVSGGADGDYHAMDKASEILQTVNRAVAAAYMRKTGKSEEELLALMDAETWYTAQGAVDIGLIDKISEPAQRFVAAVSGVLPASVVQKIRNTVVKEPVSGADEEKIRLELQLLKLKGETK